MTNTVTVHARTQDDATKPLTSISNAWKTLQNEGSKGLAIGAGAAIAAKGLMVLSGAADGVVNYVTDAIQKGSDLNETLQKSSVVFGSAASGIKAWGSIAATSMGLSENAAIAAAASIGNLLRSTGTAQEKIAPMSEGIVKLAADLASFNNIPIEDALAKLQSGLVGQERPLRELGVAISAASVDSEALALGFKKVNGVFTEGEKVQARYALIFQQTQTAQGDFARTSDQLANSQRIAKAEMENISAEIGTDLLPAVLGLERGFLSLLDTLEGFKGQRGVIDQSISTTLTTGTLDQLKQAKAALEQGLKDLGSGPLSLQALAPGGNQAAADFRAQLDAINAAIDLAERTANDSLDHFQKDLDRVEPEHFQRSIVGSFGVVKKSALDLATDYEKSQRRIRASALATVKQLSSDVQAEIDGYFNPIEQRAALHDLRLQLSADEKVRRNAKTKEDQRKASDAIIQSLDDEASALNGLGVAGALSLADVDTYTADVTAAYKAMGKKVPPEIQAIIDHLHSLAAIPDINTKFTFTLEQKGNLSPAALDKIAKDLGYIGNTDITKKGKNPFKGTGGPVREGDAYIVGERGPEWFVPDKAGSILPNGTGPKMGAAIGGGPSLLAGASGGGTVNVSLNWQTVFPPTPAQAQQIGRQIVPAIAQEMVRRGLIRRTSTSGQT